MSIIQSYTTNHPPKHSGLNWNNNCSLFLWIGWLVCLLFLLTLWIGWLVCLLFLLTLWIDWPVCLFFLLALWIGWLICWPCLDSSGCMRPPRTLLWQWSFLQLCWCGHWLGLLVSPPDPLSTLSVHHDSLYFVTWGFGVLRGWNRSCGTF